MARKNDDSRREERSEGQLEEKVLYINRCSKVVKGGRKFSFSALILVGDGQGRVGYGFAKANELSDSIRKGGEAARKNMIHLDFAGQTIPHEIMVEWDGSCLLMKPAPAGTGIIAGSKVRSVLELAGVTDIVTKSLGSNHPINQVKAVFKALTSFMNREKTLKARGVA